MLFIDLLAIHMIRNVNESTVISYHPESTWCQTSAERLQSLMLLVGGSVYWQNIFTKTKDPTFLFITILWYALYAWDESFELLYNHVTKLVCSMLMRVACDVTQNIFRRRMYCTKIVSSSRAIFISCKRIFFTIKHSFITSRYQ
jgi:hypothetical protein